MSPFGWSVTARQQSGTVRVRTCIRRCAVAACLLVSGCATMPSDHGITNLRQVTPTAWRSGQPTTLEQWGYLRNLGVAAAFKLNCDDEGGGRDDLDAQYVGIQVMRLCMSPRTDQGALGLVELFRGPNDVELEALDWLAKAIAAYDGAPVLWHCVNGRERTGLLAGMVVRYRYGWTRGESYRYMLDTGFRPVPGIARAWKRWNEEVYRP